MAVKIFESAFAIYTTQEIIGEGGSGVVYKALDENSNVVAVKCLDLKKSTKEKQKRFKNEINFCLRNTHKNIVPITDYGVYAQGKENTMFYVMPYYPSTLRKLMDNKIEPEKALIYFSQILDGLEAAHLKSVWHRDLKPENILYDPIRDILILADFGIAHFGEEFLKTSIETKKDTRLANFRYAAPEQRGSGEKVDQRTDLFSLGMILYEMYTGLLLQGTGYKRVGEVLPEYSYLDNLIENLTRQSPANRPVSIDEVKKNLIGHENDYISRQRLDQLSKTVVPETEISDPLVINPIAIQEVDYQNGSLIFFLSQKTSDRWETAFREIGNFTFIPGEIEPGLVGFSGDTAVVKIPSYRTPDQQFVDLVKDYISRANALYAERARAAHKGRLQQEKEQLRIKIKEEEKRQEFRNKIKL